MVLTDRQLRLVQAGATILQDELFLSLNKSLSTINNAMTAESEHRSIDMEELDSKDAEFRKKFIRGVVIRITKELRKNAGVSDEKVKKAIDKFIKVIEEIWNP